MAVNQLNKTASVLSTSVFSRTVESATLENTSISWALEQEAARDQALHLTMAALRTSPMFRYAVEFYNRDNRATAALQRFVRSREDELIADDETRSIRHFAARMFLAGRLAERAAAGKAVQA